MTSRMVTLRQRKGRAVEAALQTHGNQVVQTLTERLAPLVEEGETAADLSPVLTLLHRLLSRQRQNLVDMDEAHLAELATGQERRRRRDLATAELITQVIETRRLLEGTFGREDAVRITGLAGRTDRTPLEVLRQAERLVGRLTAPDLELPADLHGGIQFDPLAVADELRPPLQALRTALDELDRDRREREVTLVAKTRTLAEFDSTLAPTSLVVEGLLRLAGLEEYADRLRAFPRRPSPSETPEDPAETGEPDAAAGDGEASAGSGEAGDGEPGGEGGGGEAGGSGSGAGGSGAPSTPGVGAPSTVGDGPSPPPTGSGGTAAPAAPS